jgi:hypothetical protein
MTIMGKPEMRSGPPVLKNAGGITFYLTNDKLNGKVMKNKLEDSLFWLLAAAVAAMLAYMPFAAMDAFDYEMERRAEQARKILGDK